MRSCVRHAARCWSMPVCGSIDAGSGPTSRPVSTVRCIAIGGRCRNVSRLSCAGPGPGCCFTIRYRRSGIYGGGGRAAPDPHIRVHCLPWRRASHGLSAGPGTAERRTIFRAAAHLFSSSKKKECPRKRAVFFFWLSPSAVRQESTVPLAAMRSFASRSGCSCSNSSSYHSPSGVWT